MPNQEALPRGLRQCVCPKPPLAAFRLSSTSPPPQTEAIAAAYELAEKSPEAELAPLHLGCVKAGFTPDGWRYTRGESPPYAKYAHVFDDYGVIALHLGMVRVEDATEA